MVNLKNTSDKNLVENNFDYSYVSTIARIAIYDDSISAPRIIKIKPNKTAEYIEELASNIYSNAQQLGGSIPYTAIREVTENYIHARFKEIVVSILNKGKTIRFADQGPGIHNKEKAQLPGFSSAVEPMKEYIRGVGSGLPIVKEYLNFTKGNITIEDNLNTGAVITLNQEIQNNSQQQPYQQELQFNSLHNYQNNFKKVASSNQFTTQQNQQDVNFTIDIDKNNITPQLTDKEKVFMSYLFSNGPMRVTDLVKLTESAPSSTHSILKKLEEKKLVTHDGNKRRMLTSYGNDVVKTL